MLLLFLCISKITTPSLKFFHSEWKFSFPYCSLLILLQCWCWQHLSIFLCYFFPLLFFSSFRHPALSFCTSRRASHVVSQFFPLALFDAYREPRVRSSSLIRGNPFSRWRLLDSSDARELVCEGVTRRVCRAACVCVCHLFFTIPISGFDGWHLALTTLSPRHCLFAKRNEALCAWIQWPTSLLALPLSRSLPPSLSLSSSQTEEWVEEQSVRHNS